MDIFIKSSKRLVDEVGKQIFVHNDIRTTNNSDGVAGIATDVMHIERVYSDKAVDYVTKNINYTGDNLLYLERNGINIGDINFSVLYN